MTMSDQPLLCTEEHREPLNAEFDELRLHEQPNNVYVGNVLDVNSVPTGEFRMWDGERAPLTVTIAKLANQIDGSTGVRIEDPTWQNVQDGVNVLVQRVLDERGPTRADVTVDWKHVEHESETNVELGLHYDGSIAEINSELSYDSTDERTTKILDLTQEYFTVHVDLAATEAFLQLDDDGPPDPKWAVVSSVTYGRRILWAFHSALSESELKLAIDAEAGSFEGDLTLEQEEKLEETQVRAFVHGGSAEAASGPVASALDDPESFESVQTLLEEETTFDSTTVGAPISYELTYLNDLSRARVELTTEEYTVRNCERVTNTYKVENFQIEPRETDRDIHGWIGVEGKYDGDDYYPRESAQYSRDNTIWRREESQERPMPEGERTTLNNATATIEFPQTETVLESLKDEGYIYVAVQLEEDRSTPFRSNRKQWMSDTFYLDEVTSDPDDEKEILFTGDEFDDMSLYFEINPVQ